MQQLIQAMELNEGNLIRGLTISYFIINKCDGHDKIVIYFFGISHPTLLMSTKQ